MDSWFDRSAVPPARCLKHVIALGRIGTAPPLADFPQPLDRAPILILISGFVGQSEAS
jgi:hypothetical protein